MLSKYLENNKPITFVIVLLALLIGGGIYYNQELPVFFSSKSTFILIILNLLFLFISLLLLHQIDRWNELTETKNCYSIAFFSIFIVLFPYLFEQIRLVLANLLIIIALWRVLTLKTGTSIAQKLFDTSLLVVCASLLHPWALLFLLNIWISLLFYGDQKRRYWFIPFLALLIIGMLLGAVLLILQEPFPLENPYQEIAYCFIHLLELPSYTSVQWLSIVSLGVLLLVSLIVYYFKSTYHSISSLVVIQFLWVGLLVAFLSKEVIYVFAPIAVLFALYVEKIRIWWLKETFLWLLLSLPAVSLLLHFIAKG